MEPGSSIGEAEGKIVRILYGVAGEGNGHGTRSKVVIERLIEQGHHVVVVASKNALTVLRAAFTNVVEVEGIQLRYQRGAIDIIGSLAMNLAHAAKMIEHNVGAAEAIDVSFAPQAVVTDLDPFVYLYGITRGVPVVSIDNHQAIARCVHPPDVVAADPVGIRQVGLLLRKLMPGCCRYVITTLSRMPVQADLASTTTIVPPVLRREVLLAQVASSFAGGARGGHTLVYQSDSGNSEAVLSCLSRFPTEQFVVYGLKREENWRNCSLKLFSESGFVRDLASAKAVISNGGYSLLSEAVALGKPVLSVPIRGQPEQAFNAAYVEHLGFGSRAVTLEPRVLGSFLAQIPRYARILAAAPRHDANRRLYDELDTIFGPGCTPAL